MWKISICLFFQKHLEPFRSRPSKLYEKRYKGILRTTDESKTPRTKNMMHEQNMESHVGEKATSLASVLAIYGMKDYGPLLRESLENWFTHGEAQHAGVSIKRPSLPLPRDPRDTNNTHSPSFRTKNPSSQSSVSIKEREEKFWVENLFMLVFQKVGFPEVRERILWTWFCNCRGRQYRLLKYCLTVWMVALEL